MNITKKLIITDTNIITDLDNANLLENFVKIDNVYLSDMVRNDEINSNTGNITIINIFKTISATSEQIQETIQIHQNKKKLSTFDILNYILARDNNGILATGDNRLKIFSEENNVKVIRTLKIIELMHDNGIITTDQAINGCILLKDNESTRIPHTDIDAFINKLKQN